MTMPYSKRSTTQFEINISMRNRKPSWRERKERERERQTDRQTERERNRERAMQTERVPSSLHFSLTNTCPYGGDTSERPSNEHATRPRLLYHMTFS